MENDTNMAISGLPLTSNTDISTTNSDVTYSNPTINLNNDDLKTHADKKEITALLKKDGAITGYELSNGERISKEKAVELAKNSGLSGISVSSRNGEEYLRSSPDQNEDNNLSSLPIVNE